MRVLKFLKFWKPNTSKPELTFQDGEEGEDSFFDLKRITPPGLCNKNGRELNNQTTKQTNGVSSKRRILPVEYSFKPQSPIALLKSAPKLSVFVSKKQKATAAREVDEPEIEKNQEDENRDFPIKFCREGSSSNGKISSTKQKSLNLIKLLYPKLLKTSIEKSIFTEEFSASSSPATTASLSSPFKEKQANIPANSRQVCRHLSKSKSASASATILAKHGRDDSFTQYHDEIQSAILHCKSSLNSSKDSSTLEGRDSSR